MLTTKNISSIRVIAMFGILVTHSVGSYLKFIVSNDNVFDVSLAIVSIVKFSTIVFFLISGYLFELNKNKYTDFKLFMKGKYTNLVKPYLLLFLIPICLFFLVFHPNFHETSFKTIAFWYLETILEQVFLTNYWFIPVLLLYFVINFFTPYKALRILFPISICITLFYSVNLYYNFIRTEHTLSFLGFLSFFFLGRIQVYKKYKPIKIYFKILLTVLFFILSIAEARLLHYHFHSTDAENTLRISSIFFSLSVVVLLKDLPQLPTRILQIDTYFIYLIHIHLLRITSFVYVLANFKLYSWPLFIILIFSFILLCVAIQSATSRIKKSPILKLNRLFIISKS